MLLRNQLEVDNRSNRRRNKMRLDFTQSFTTQKFKVLKTDNNFVSFQATPRYGLN